LAKDDAMTGRRGCVVLSEHHEQVVRGRHPAGVRFILAFRIYNLASL